MPKYYTYASGLKYNWIRKLKVLATVAFQFRLKNKNSICFTLITENSYEEISQMIFIILCCLFVEFNQWSSEAFYKETKVFNLVYFNYVLFKNNSTCENGSKGLSDRSKSVSLVRWTNISGCTVWDSSYTIANINLPGCDLTKREGLGELKECVVGG